MRCQPKKRNNASSIERLGIYIKGVYLQSIEVSNLKARLSKSKFLIVMIWGVFC